MISAYTLVRVEPNKSAEVLNKIRRIATVKEVVPVYGEYDLLLETETKSLEELDLLVYNSLRTIPEIAKTTTMVVAKIE